MLLTLYFSTMTFLVFFFSSIANFTPLFKILTICICSTVCSWSCFGWWYTVSWNYYFQFGHHAIPICIVVYLIARSMCLLTWQAKILAPSLIPYQLVTISCYRFCKRYSNSSRISAIEFYVLFSCFCEGQFSSNVFLCFISSSYITVTYDYKHIWFLYVISFLLNTGKNSFHCFFLSIYRWRLDLNDYVLMFFSQILHYNLCLIVVHLASLLVPRHLFHVCHFQSKNFVIVWKFCFVFSPL